MSFAIAFGGRLAQRDYTLCWAFCAAAGAGKVGLVDHTVNIVPISAGILCSGEAVKPEFSRS
jgi:hypothetical protein